MGRSSTSTRSTTACASTRVTWPPSIPATVSRFPGRAFGRACSQSSEDLMRIVFHGFNALPFHQDFDRALKVPAEVHYMPDQLAPEDEAVYAGADAVIGIRYDATLPRFSNLKLFQV